MLAIEFRQLGQLGDTTPGPGHIAESQKEDLRGSVPSVVEKATPPVTG